MGFYRDLEVNSLEKFEYTENRFRYILLGLLLIFLILIFRLFHLQIIEGKRFKGMSENNSLRMIRSPAPRGLILDRNGQILAGNYPSFDLLLLPDEVKNLQDLLSRLSSFLHLSDEGIENKVSLAQELYPYRTVKLKEGLSWKELALYEAKKAYFPEVILEVMPKRVYSNGSLVSHLLGYLGEISPEELDKQDKVGLYKRGDTIGKTGIESGYESYLRGKDGGRQIIIDALGREVEEIKEIVPSPGYNLRLNIDLSIQRTAEKALGKNPGAVVVMNPMNGEILSMVSSPSFDPNNFARRLTRKEWEELVNNPLKPLQNKAIQGVYPPGSIFKIVVAVAALEEGVITPETELFCPGFYHLGKRLFYCWKKDGHGWVNLYKALTLSCDVYFYQVGLRLGIDKIAYYAKLFGLGTKTNIDLSGERNGLVPSKEWKKRRFSLSWQIGETLSSTIGQSYNLVSPLQMAVLISALANGGKVYIPKIVKDIERDGKIVMDNRPQIVSLLPFSSHSMEIVRNALWGVVNESYGTGSRARIGGVDVAGKTGTAQVVSIPRRQGIPIRSFYAQKDHSWFIAFAPKNKPEIALSVLVEHGGSGGGVAASIAREIFFNYFYPKRENNGNFEKERP